MRRHAAPFCVQAVEGGPGGREPRAVGMRIAAGPSSLWRWRLPRRCCRGPRCRPRCLLGHMADPRSRPGAGEACRGAVLAPRGDDLPAGVVLASREDLRGGGVWGVWGGVASADAVAAWRRRGQIRRGGDVRAEVVDGGRWSPAAGCGARGWDASRAEARRRTRRGRMRSPKGPASGRKGWKPDDSGVRSSRRRRRSAAPAAPRPGPAARRPARSGRFVRGRCRSGWPASAAGCSCR